MALERMKVWKDRANTYRIELSKDDTVLTSAEMAEIVKVELRYKDVYYSSLDHFPSFDWATLATDGILILKPGLLPMPAGSDVAELIIYTSINGDGIMWMQIATLVNDDAIK